MVRNINFKKIFIVCMVLTVFLCLSAVSASDLNETTNELISDEDDVEGLAVDEQTAAVSQADEEVLGNSTAKTVTVTSKTSQEKVFIKNSKLDIQITDKKKNGIANKTLQVTVNNKVSNYTTDANGHVYVKLTAKGTYTVSYTFNNEGYSTLTRSKTVTVVTNSKSKISGSTYVAYVGVNNPFSILLTTGGEIMTRRPVTFKLNGKTYDAQTNLYGKAKFNIKLSVGTYRIKYYYKGEANSDAASGSSKIIVRKGMPTDIVRMNLISYKHQTSAPLIFKYKDVRGNPIANQKLILKINKKTVIKKTNSKGLATFYIKQNKGVYNIKVYSYNTNAYKKSLNTYSIKVSYSDTKFYGFWLHGADMKKVNLEAMARKGVNQIFLNHYALDLYGESAVADFACEAKSLGIGVQIWLSTFYDGSWISPVNDDGSYKYDLFNSIINKAKKYAKIKGVAGIHFDYIRFPGTAYKHSNGADAVTYFTKTACKALHKQNPSLIVSAAFMPEPGALKSYYGQDVAAMSKYLDMLVPMVYKGNYNQNAAWIQSITEYFVKNSKGAIVLTGLQGYASDSNVKKISASELKNDAKHANSGGANGVIVFRYTLFNTINFYNL